MIWKIRIHLRMRYNGRRVGIALLVLWVMGFCSTGFVQLLQLELINCVCYNIIHSPVNHPNSLATLRRNTKFLIKWYISDIQYKMQPKYRNSVDMWATECNLYEFGLYLCIANKKYGHILLIDYLLDNIYRCTTYFDMICETFPIQYADVLVPWFVSKWLRMIHKSIFLQIIPIK